MGRWFDLTKKLQQIYDLEVDLEFEHREKETRVLSFLKCFKDFCLKSKSPFADYFHDFYYTGSYFEGLRVKTADEFDVNLVFNLPENESLLEIKDFGDCLPYLTVRLEKDSRKKQFKNLFFDKNGYLSSQGLLSWLQALLCWFRESLPSDKDLNNHQRSEGNGSPLYKEHINFTNSGPSRTIKLQYEGSKGESWVSVDLVPVFRIKPEVFLFHRLESIQNLSLGNYTGFLVPKVLRSTLFSDEILNVCDAFRIHFPGEELKFLTNNKWVKKLIKLIKYLNEKQKWNLPSYFVKVAVLSMVRDKSYLGFGEDQIGDAFMLFLERFEDILTRRHLGHLCYPKFNLLHDLSHERFEKLLQKVRTARYLLLIDTRYVFELYGLTDMNSVDYQGITI